MISDYTIDYLEEQISENLFLIRLLKDTDPVGSVQERERLTRETGDLENSVNILRIYRDR